MAIQKPYNLSINGNMLNGSTIDPTIQNVISWSSSGDISTAFQVQIYDNTTNILSFDSGVITSYNISYTLAANAIASNKQYKVQITAFDSSGNSATSFSQILATSLTPTVTIDTIPNPVASQTYNFTAEYSQSENIPMLSYSVYLYDDNKILIAQSNILTGTPIEYMFDGLDNGSSYYVEFQATSQKGLVGSSGLVPFTAQYVQPRTSLVLTATNNDSTSGIDLTWNVVQIIGIGTNYTLLPPEEIDVTNGSVTYSSGLSVESDFTARIWFRSPVHNTPLLTLGGTNGGKIWVEYHDDYRFHVYKSMPNCTKITHCASDVCDRFYFLGANQSMAWSASTKYLVAIEQSGSNLNIYASVTG